MEGRANVYMQWGNSEDTKGWGGGGGQSMSMWLSLLICA